MLRFTPSERLTAEEKALKDHVLIAFKSVPLRTLRSDDLIWDESDHLAGLTWMQLADNPEELSLSPSEMSMLTIADTAYMLPAFIIMALGNPESEHDIHLESMLTPGEILFKDNLREQLNDVQRSVVSKLLAYRLGKWKEALALAAQSTHPASEQEINAIEARFANAISYWTKR